MEQTLKELKAENEAEEAEQTAAEQADNPETEGAESPPQADKVTEETEAEDSKDETQPDAESGDTKTEEDEDATWMQSEDHASEAEKKFTDYDVGRAKEKLRAKLERKHSGETEELKQRIAELEGQAPVTTGLVKPKREDFYDNEDPDAAYIEAMSDYVEKKAIATVKAEHATETKTREAQSLLKANEKAVDQHYERAMALAKRSDIAPETYQAADRRVREAIDGLYPEKGDIIADQLIAYLGEGSEKVFYNLGINPSRLSDLVGKLTEDKSGVKASMYLGELKGRLLQPHKRRSAAPKPAAAPKGDGDSPSTRTLHKKYEEAHKAGDTQAAWKARKAAKDAGADVTKW